MKKILKVIGILILLIIVFILVAGLFVSKTYHLERDITINAPKQKVWANVSTLHAMHNWNPWIEADPNIKITYAGNPDGQTGAIYKWDGNDDVGSGEQTITKTNAPERIETHVHFIRPFDGEADTYVTLTETGNGTKATWGFDSKYSYPMNVMLMFINMDEMMGNSYNKGLNKLKTISETN